MNAASPVAAAPAPIVLPGHLQELLALDVVAGKLDHRALASVGTDIGIIHLRLLGLARMRTSGYDHSLRTGCTAGSQ